MADLLRRFFLPAALILLLAAGSVVPLPAYLESPGAPIALDPLVVVSDPAATAVDGEFLLLTVDLRPATAVLLPYAAVADHVGLVPHSRIIPPGQTDAGYFRRQREVFRTNVEVAAAVALAAAGYPVDPTVVVGDGVRIVRVLPGTPAAEALRPGDVIVAVDGEPVQTVEDLRAALAGAQQPHDLTFERGGRRRGTTLTPVPTDIGGETVVVIGVEAETRNPRIDLPVPVDVGQRDVGGPSAGLLVALTVYDKVRPDVDLAAGRRIAGTGTISEAGRIGRVGGVGQKVLGALSAGADVFLVPAEQEEEARAALPAASDMALAAVTTFDDAVQTLAGRRLGCAVGRWQAGGPDLHGACGARIVVPPGVAPGG